MGNIYSLILWVAIVGAVQKIAILILEALDNHLHRFPVRVGSQHQFTVVWAAEPYVPYGLQSSPNLQQPWTLFATGLTSSNAAGYQVLTSPITNTRQFCRLLKER